MEKKELVQILFRVSRGVVQRFDSVLKSNGLTRQAVLEDFAENYNESQATGFLMSRDKLGELENELGYHEATAKEIREQIAAFRERAARLQPSAKPKAPRAGAKGGRD